MAGGGVGLAHEDLVLSLRRGLYVLLLVPDTRGLGGVE